MRPSSSGMGGFGSGCTRVFRTTVLGIEKSRIICARTERKREKKREMKQEQTHDERAGECGKRKGNGENGENGQTPEQAIDAAGCSGIEVFRTTVLGMVKSRIVCAMRREKDQRSRSNSQTRENLYTQTVSCDLATKSPVPGPARCCVFASSLLRFFVVRLLTTILVIVWQKFTSQSPKSS